ncbi:hypothetical protein BKG93_11230 [Rodentibacter ratti]|uniref:Uncharacterized protein n=1 Tax=Rodentibacter ratti TaxID=1906745 RepID=A0A1V3KY12_9PAST|nr:hypothetical protein [Rodentibacter ratti]OOF82505.1 hypothetical protein BKG93_11230 [Rodentibacter ratti]
MNEDVKSVKNRRQRKKNYPIQSGVSVEVWTQIQKMTNELGLSEAAVCRMLIHKGLETLEMK